MTDDTLPLADELTCKMVRAMLEDRLSLDIETNSLHPYRLGKSPVDPMVVVVGSSPNANISIELVRAMSTHEQGMINLLLGPSEPGPTLSTDVQTLLDSIEAVEMPVMTDLSSFDYRTANQAPRSQRRRKGGRR